MRITRQSANQGKRAARERNEAAHDNDSFLFFAAFLDLVVALGQCLFSAREEECVVQRCFAFSKGGGG